MEHSLIRLILSQTGLSVFPVLVFLLALALIDTYRLMTLRRILGTVGLGCGVAILCWLLNTAVYATGLFSPHLWARSGAPVVEEIAKGLYVAWLIRTNRVAFMVDSAIAGFALGAGFSVIENISYIPDLTAAGLLASAIRGLGTAMMHGGATALFAVVSNNLAEIHGARLAASFLPGLVLATAIHTLYNQPVLAPVQHAVIVLLALPVLLSLIFWRSEKALATWLGTRLDKDIDLLQMMTGGSFTDSPAGRYLTSLKATFAPDIVGDMLCYLQICLELSARAKGDLLRREMGFPVTGDPELPSRLRELNWLERRIGRAGKLALAPLLGHSRRDVWELQQLASR